MKRVFWDESWPDSWKYSYPFDLEEIYGDVRKFGYFYAYARRRTTAISLLKEALPSGSRILDIAAAQGNFTLPLAESGYEVTWNDLRTDLVGYVQMKHEHGSVEYAPGNAFELNFPAPFDAVLITEVIEHVAHPDDFLKKVAELVRPGGYIVMTTPNGRYIRNTLPKFSDCPDPSRYEAVQFKPDADGHIFLLHPDEIEGLARMAGVTVDSLLLFNNPLTCGHLKTERLLRLLPRHVVDVIEDATQKLPIKMAERALLHMAARFRKPQGGGSAS